VAIGEHGRKSSQSGRKGCRQVDVNTRPIQSPTLELDRAGFSKHGKVRVTLLARFSTTRRGSSNHRRFAGRAAAAEPVSKATRRQTPCWTAGKGHPRNPPAEQLILYSADETASKLFSITHATAKNNTSYLKTHELSV
jgi:hypothetical protein